MCCCRRRRCHWKRTNRTRISIVSTNRPKWPKSFIISSIALSLSPFCVFRRASNAFSKPLNNVKHTIKIELKSKMRVRITIYVILSSLNCLLDIFRSADLTGSSADACVRVGVLCVFIHLARLQISININMKLKTIYGATFISCRLLSIAHGIVNKVKLNTFHCVVYCWII